jgi:hypothetical protein
MISSATFLEWSPMRSMALARNSRSRLGDGARIFHHVGDELAHKAVELVVDQIVLLEDGHRRLGVQARKASSALRSMLEAISAATRSSLRAANGRRRFR